MKKYIGVISGIIFALSIGIASAQVTGNLGTCVIWNKTCSQYEIGSDGKRTGNCLKEVNTTCKQWVGVSGGGTNGNGGSSAGSSGGGVPVMNGNQQVSNQSSIVRGQTQRQSTTADLSFVTNLLAQAGGIISMLPKLLMGVAVVMFFVFLIRFFIIDADKAEDKQKAVKGMGYSLAAIFVMVTLWGIIAFFGDAIGLNPTATVYAPQLPK